MCNIYKDINCKTNGGIIGGTIVDQVGGPIGGPIGGPVGGPVSGPVGGPVGNLTDRQKEVLGLIENDAKLSKRKLAKLLNINVSAAQAYIEILKEKGLIKRIGGKMGSWKVSKN